MSKNNSGTYSYYFDKFIGKLYDFNDKELAVRNYIAYMLDRTQRIFEYTGLPDTVPARMLEFLLQVNGYACFTKVEGDLYAFYGGLGGEPDAYYRPTICVVANPYLKFNKTLKIGEDCVIMRNDSLLYGLLPLFSRYATAMAENDISFRLSSVNTRIEFLLSAPDDATKKAAEKFLKDIEDGKQGVIASNEFLEGIKAQEVGRSMRTFTDLIEYQQYLKASWFNEIGLNANYNMKREKLSTTESQMNNDALLPLVEDMLEQRRVALEKINEMFGTNISVDFASSWEKLLKEFEAESNQLDMEEGEDDAGRGMVDESETSNTNVEVGESETSSEENEERITDSESIGNTEETLEGQPEVENSDDGDEGGVVVNVEVNVGEAETVEVSEETEESEVSEGESTQLDTEEEGEDDESDGSMEQESRK